MVYQSRLSYFNDCSWIPQVWLDSLLEWLLFKHSTQKRVEPTISGDTRSFTDQALHKIEKAIERVVAGQYSFNNSFLSTINAPEETEHAIKAVQAVVGVENVDGSCERFTISEDFSFMLREVKGCYVLVGNGVGECGGTALHNPHYDFNDNILKHGVGFWKTLVEQQLLL